MNKTTLDLTLVDGDVLLLLVDDDAHEAVRDPVHARLDGREAELLLLARDSQPRPRLGQDVVQQSDALGGEGVGVRVGVRVAQISQTVVLDLLG